MRLGVLVMVLAIPFAWGAQQQQNQGVPDAPTPQSTNSLSGLAGQVAPGKGTPGPAADTSQVPSTTPGVEDRDQGPPPEIPKQGQLDQAITTFRTSVTAVILPVTVLDRKHQQVSGLTYRDFEVLEDNIPQHIFLFNSDARPLSVALVIDQSLPQDTMQKVNDSLGAIQGAFTPADAIAVFTYSDGVNQQTTFTAAQGARLPAVLQASKKAGDDLGIPISGGPLFGGPQINGHSVDPNLEPGRDVSGPAFPIIPKEIHTLNDAILAAGNALSTQPADRLRIIYVISDGKESRSKASFREVVHYLEANQISVYGTLVGDSATWGLGYLDKFKLPLLPLSADNILPRYVNQTGGHLEAEFSQNGIEHSFEDLAALGRTQYTIGYMSHLPVMDGKYRTVEVRVRRPQKSVDVITEKGYYPTATNLNR